jgi:hypothetical protein
MESSELGQLKYQDILELNLDQSGTVSNISDSSKLQSNKKHFHKIDQLTTLDLSEKLKRAGNVFKIKALRLSNQNFVIAYQNSSRNLTLITIDPQGKVLNEKVNINSGPIHNLYDLCLAKFKQGVFVYYYGLGISKLQYYGESLNLLKEMSFGKDNNLNNCFATNEVNTFILSNPHGGIFRNLNIYNSNLTLIQTISQYNETLPFYFPPKVTSLAVNNDYFFMLDETKEIHLVNRNDGKIFKQFKIAANSLCLYLEKYILSYEPISSTLFVYDFNGKLGNQQKLVNINYNSELLHVSSQELIFFNKFDSTLTLHFLN